VYPCVSGDSAASRLVECQPLSCKGVLKVSLMSSGVDSVKKPGDRYSFYICFCMNE
jgi:hypothetical protein